MSVSDGEKVNASVTNAAYISRKTDSNTTAKVDLDNTDAASGSSVNNIQREHNSIASFVGKLTNQVYNFLPTWASDVIGTPNQAVKDRVDSVQSAVETNQTNIATNTADIATNAADIATNAGNISDNTSDISDIRTTTGTSDGDTDMGAYASATVTDNQSTKQNIIDVVTQTDTNTTDIATLQSNPVFELQGTWDASTNTPTLADGVGTTGDAYKVTVAGTQDLGSGNISFIVGDLVYYDGAVWFKDAEPVFSVNGAQGVVVLDTDDISDAAATNKYYASSLFDADLATKDTDDLTEGATNLYNQTHTGEITGDTALTVNPTAITNKTTTTPESGDFFLFSDTSDSGNLKKADVDDILGGGGGLGGINYVLNPDAETDTSNTSSTANITINRDTVSPARGDGSFRMIMSSAVNGNYGQWDLDAFDNADLNNGKRIPIEFEYSTSTGLSSGDIKVVIRDNTATADIDVDDLVPSGGLTKFTKFTGYFDVPDGSSDFDLRFVCTTSIASETFELDNLKVGPDTIVPGSIVENPVPFTPNWTNLTVGNAEQDFRYTRIGKLMHIQGTIKLGSTSSVGATPGFDIPGGFTADEFTNSLKDGTALLYDADNNANRQMGRAYIFNDAVYPASAAANLQSTLPFTWAQDDRIEVNVMAEINEWSSGAMLSTTAIGLQTAQYYGNAVAAQSIPDNTFTTVEFDNEVDTHSMASGSTTSFRLTAKEDGLYLAASCLAWATSANLDYASIQILHYDKNDVSKGARLLLNNDFNGVSSSGSGVLPLNMVKDDYILIQVRQNDTGSAARTLNTTSNFSLTKIPDFSTFSVWGENAFLETTSSVKTPPGSGFYYNMVGNSITLPAGTKWMLHGQVEFSRSGVTNYSRGIARWATANGTDTASAPAGLPVEAGRISSTHYPNTADLVEHSLMAPTVRVDAGSSGTTLYLVPYAIMATPANSRITTYIYAEKIL